MSKRFQVSLSKEEKELFQKAAKRENLSTAEWARKHLRAKAQEILSPSGLTPQEALRALFQLNAPIDDVQKMIQESTQRYGRRS